MGMYATCHTAEDSLSLDTKWLKDHGYFCGYKNEGISWKWGWGDNESSIGLSVDTTGDFPNIRFRYSTKHWNGEEKKHMDYSFPLIQVPCNLGGFRWAFKCGLWVNGVYCGRTVYTLYKANSDYFGCRKCIRIVYESQRESGKSFEFLGKILKAEREYEKVYKSIRKWHYRGRPTRKVIKLNKLEAQIPPVEEAEKMFNTLLGRV